MDSECTFCALYNVQPHHLVELAFFSLAVDIICKLIMPSLDGRYYRDRIGVPKVSGEVREDMTCTDSADFAGTGNQLSS